MHATRSPYEACNSRKQNLLILKRDRKYFKSVALQ